MRDEEITAIRTGVAYSHEPDVVALRVSGEDAFSVMERACAADLLARDGQVRPTVLLDERARVFADVYAGQDDDACLLFSEGPSVEALRLHLSAAAAPGARFAIEELTADHEALSIHGPFAWELIGELLGPDLIGLPYLAFYRVDDVLCLRGGKTGEYGYDLFVPKARAAELRARVEEVGRAFDLVLAGRDALDQCQLENGFFNVRREGKKGLSPIDLGLQWRVSYEKDSFVGVEPLRALRAAGVHRRVTYLVASGPVGESERVFYQDAPIGEILAAGWSPVAGVHVAAALIERPYFHAGIQVFTAGGEGARVAVSTVSPPVVHNRSLYVNPQRHAYATRDRDAFPPLSDEFARPAATP